MASVAIASIVWIQVLCMWTDTSPSQVVATASRPTTQSGSGVSARHQKQRPSPFLILPSRVYLARVLAAGGIPHQMNVQGAVRRTTNDGKVVMLFCARVASETVKKTVQRADEIGIRVFNHAVLGRPKPGCRIWPGYDNPLINNLRELRMATAGKPTYATIPYYSGQVPGIRGKRRIIFEEYKWMVLAAIGAEYDGILWGHGYTPTGHAKQLPRLEGLLVAYAEDLGQARIVGWASNATVSGQAVSVLSSRRKLFVVLLNKDYMAIGEDRETITFPLEESACEGAVTITPPAGVSVKSGKTLYGMHVPVAQDGRSFVVKYSFSGGGEMLILNLSGDAGKSIATTPGKDAGAATTRASGSEAVGREPQPGR